MGSVSQKALDEAVRRWQKRLRLQDWDVTAALIHPQDNEGSRGRCHIHRDHKAATIRITIPALNAGLSMPERVDRCTDWERTLVHELLHLHFDAFEPEAETLTYSMWEQAVEILAGVLVDTWRAKSS